MMTKSATTTTTTTAATTTRRKTPTSNKVKGELFPEILHRLLEETEENGESDTISWHTNGLCFKVHDKKEFVEKILSRYFRLSQYKSFVRQLNWWGFSCINVRNVKGYYQHDRFIRGRKDLCNGMFRERLHRGRGSSPPQPSSAGNPHSSTNQASSRLLRGVSSSPASSFSLVLPSSGRSSSSTTPNNNTVSTSTVQNLAFGSFHANRHYSHYHYGSQDKSSWYDSPPQPPSVGGGGGGPIPQQALSFLANDTTYDDTATAVSSSTNSGYPSSSMILAADPNHHAAPSGGDFDVAGRMTIGLPIIEASIDGVGGRSGGGGGVTAAHQEEQCVVQPSILQPAQHPSSLSVRNYGTKHGNPLSSLQWLQSQMMVEESTTTMKNVPTQQNLRGLPHPSIHQSGSSSSSFSGAIRNYQQPTHPIETCYKEASMTVANDVSHSVGDGDGAEDWFSSLETTFSDVGGGVHQEQIRSSRQVYNASASASEGESILEPRRFFSPRF